ncbi:hypothetical protein BJ546DRAFT_971031 [Cryomyces antarcticus]
MRQHRAYRQYRTPNQQLNNTGRVSTPSFGNSDECLLGCRSDSFGPNTNRYGSGGCYHGWYLWRLCRTDLRLSEYLRNLLFAVRVLWHRTNILRRRLSSPVWRLSPNWKYVVYLIRLTDFVRYRRCPLCIDLRLCYFWAYWRCLVHTDSCVFANLVSSYNYSYACVSYSCTQSFSCFAGAVAVQRIYSVQCQQCTSVDGSCTCVREEDEGEETVVENRLYSLHLPLLSLAYTRRLLSTLSLSNASTLMPECMRLAPL